MKHKGRTMHCRGITYNRFYSLFMGLALLLGSHAASASQGPGLVVRQHSRVRAEVVTLADITNRSTGIDTTIRICAAPEPGRLKKLSGQSVLSIIRAQQVLPPDLALTIPDQLTVERESQQVPESDLEELLYDHLIQSGEEEMDPLRNLKIRGNKPFPFGDLELEPVPGSYRDRRGKVELKVIVTVNGKPAGKLHVSAMADRYQMAACTTRDIPRGEILAPGDVEIKQIHVAQVPKGLFPADEPVAGKAATRRLRKGSFLKERDIESPAMIRKGDQVSLVAKSGRLSVVASGIARADGALGEQIQVRNSASKKTITGRVTGPSTVEVMF